MTSRWKMAVQCFLLATFPVFTVLSLGELVARLYGGDLRIQRPLFLPRGHEEYFGMRRVFLPYEVFPPYYWLAKANTPLTNSRGFRGPEVTAERQPDTVRIACLGCSCTLGGQEPYPERLQRLLREALGNSKYEVINASAGASSTYQGLQILQRHVLPLRPDVVTIFFGWNDRWVRDGRRDSSHRLPSPAEMRLVHCLSQSKLVNALFFLADRRRSRHTEQRVPVDEYGRNLNEMITICRKNGIRVLLCTTPDGALPNTINVRFTKDTANNYPALYAMFKDKDQTPVQVWRYVHRLYNDKVHEVARRDIEVIDLDALLQERRKLYQDPDLHFFKDGIHLTELGLQETARLFALQLVQNREHAALQQYLESPEYYRVNAGRFVEQRQFAAAEDMLNRAQERAGGPVAGAETMRQTISDNRAYYEKYYAAQFQLFNGGDISLGLRMMIECLQTHPDDEDLRIDVARLALLAGNPALTLNTLRGSSIAYRRAENERDAMRLTARAAHKLGLNDLMMRQVREIERCFPNDPETQGMLEQVLAP